jgi:hypothetical protein
MCHSLHYKIHAFRFRNNNYFYIASSSNLEPRGPGLRVYVPRDRVALLYPQATDYPFVAFCDSQGYGGGILIRLHGGYTACLLGFNDVTRFDLHNYYHETVRLAVTSKVAPVGPRIRLSIPVRGLRDMNRLGWKSICSKKKSRDFWLIPRS